MTIRTRLTRLETAVQAADDRAADDLVRAALTGKGTDEDRAGVVREMGDALLDPDTAPPGFEPTPAVVHALLYEWTRGYFGVVPTPDFEQELNDYVATYRPR